MRAQYDEPHGIAARCQAEGEAELLSIAGEEFDRDFSDAGLAARCDAMMAKPARVREWIAAREQSCLPVADDCRRFVECQMALLERKWGPHPDAPPGE